MYHNNTPNLIKKRTTHQTLNTLWFQNTKNMEKIGVAFDNNF